MTTLRERFCSALVVVSLLATHTGSAGERISGLAPAMQAMVADGQIAGAQLVIGDADSVRYSGSYGVRNIESDALVDENTQFCIGSCSKMFAGAVIMTLVGGNIYSTGLELARFAPMLIHNGTREGRTVVPSPQLSEMIKPQSRRAGGGYGFGVGVQVDPVSDRTVRLSHGGALAGSYSHMLMNLETRRFGVVIYTGRRSKSEMGRMLAQWVDASPVSSTTLGPAKGTLVIVGGNDDLSDRDRYQTRWHGARFDLKRRKVLGRGTPPIPKSEHCVEGF